MKHLLKKLSFSGGGKSKPKPKPAQLKPPVLGSIQIAASYSYAELLDLISDGPIAGLVNENGLLLPSKDILQGIYLDDTAVAVSNDEVVQQEVDLGTPIDFLNTTIVGNLSQVFQNFLNNPISYGASPRQGYKIINIVKYWPGYTSIPSGNIYTDYDYIYTQNTGLTRIGSRWHFGNKNNQLNNFSDGLYWSRYLYPKTEQQYNKTLIDSELQKLYNIYNNPTTNNYEKTYIAKIFDEYLSSDWRNNFVTTSFVNSLSYDITSKLDYTKGDMKYIIKLDSTDDLTFNWAAGKAISNDKRYKFSLLDNIDNPIRQSNITIYDFLLPRIDANGNTTGKATGFFIIKITGYNKPAKAIDNYVSNGFSIPSVSILALANVSKLSLYELPEAGQNNNSVQKYNFTNLLAEYRSGEEFQSPFQFFNNVLIDKDYSSLLVGPFRTSGSVQRLIENANVNDVNKYELTVTDGDFNLDKEGSNDGVGVATDTNVTLAQQRVSKLSYSDWDKNLSVYNEKARPITHIINNPNVTSVFITIAVNSLVDTLSQDVKAIDANPKLSAGTNFATVLNLQIETGSIDEKGQESINPTIRKFKILALIQSPTFIDIGNPDLANFNSSDFKFITEYNVNNQDAIFTPFDLPEITNGVSKRYIRITKLSTETNSTLITKDCSLQKVTEIIPQNFSYPNSAIVGTKLDSRTFSSMPTRTYDCKLKKVRVPTNYNPLLTNGKDKRYYSSEAIFNQTTILDTLIYDGDWDGEFKEELEWTDNPAWILLDLITNERYGLGQYMDDSQIDIFDLYKIARFCDAVDDFGYFQGVPDGQGGLEPRFSCNILFAEGIKVFDALNTIASLFRGIIYYNNSQINFVDDRPKDPIALFSNTNVKDGFFSYSNYRRDEQFNSIEVVYIDRFENYLTKVEYIEDEEDIRKRGIFKKTINANGVTSRAMARRLGQHLIFQTIQENQSVSFSTGLEALFCRPGDLIIVEDELKNLKSNFGKVLSVNSTTKSIRLNEKFISGEFNNKLTVYTPTGYSSNNDILEIANSNRFRINGSGFYLNSGNIASPNYQILTGNYVFSGYTDGYVGEVNFPKQNQYAFYTGTNSKFCYFSTGFTGWVLGTGVPFSDNNTYSKIIFGSGDVEFTQVNTGKYNTYNTSSGNRRGGTATNTNLVGQTTGANSLFKDVSGSLQTTRGLLDSDLALSNPSQITTFNLSGIVQYDYGCEVFVDSSDINYSLVPFVKEGSVYRFQRTLADDQLYKVISIKEDNINEYSIIGTKFDTGKYALIENDKSIEYQSNTYSYTVSQKIGDTNYQVLSAPSIQQLITGLDSFGLFYISGKWKNVLNNQGYNANIKNSQGVVETQVLPINETGALFYVDGIGNYSFRVNAIGSVPDPTRNNVNFYTDSDYSQSGIFVIYEDGTLLNYDRPYLSSVTIL